MINNNITHVIVNIFSHYGNNGKTRSDQQGVIYLATAQFAHIGMNHIVQTTRVLCVMKPTTKTSKRYIERAKERGQFIDATLGRNHRSVLLLDDGTIIVSCIKPLTLQKRFALTPDQFPTDAVEDDATDLLEMDEDEEENEE